MKVRTSKNFSVSGRTDSKFPPPISLRRKSGSLDDILLCVLPLSTYLSISISLYLTIFLFLSLRAATTIPRIREYFFSLSPVRSLSRFHLSSYRILSLSFSLALYSLLLSRLTGRRLFFKLPLRRHSRLVYPATSIRIPVACYIMAYQLFCQFPVRAPDEWDFFLCFFYYFARAALKLSGSDPRRSR